MRHKILKTVYIGPLAISLIVSIGRSRYGYIGSPCGEFHINWSWR